MPRTKKTTKVPPKKPVPQTSKNGLPIHADDLRAMGEDVVAILSQMDPSKAEELMYTWPFWAREKQIAPSGDWNTWFINAGRGFGKAIKVDTPILTKGGWKLLGEVTTGDVVYDEKGQECNVVVAHEAFMSEETYEIKFSDGESIIACKDHLWVTLDNLERKTLNRKNETLPEDWANRPYLTTKELFETQTYGKRCDRTHCIPMTKPLTGEDVNILIDPYCFGYWLGDGHSKSAVITTADPEIVGFFEEAGYACKKTNSQNSGLAFSYSVDTREYVRCQTTGKMLANGSFHSKLKELGVFGNKHIPENYLRASFESRLAVLQGLIDSDGYVKDSNVEFCTTSETLADNFMELARSLGEKPTMAVGRAKLYGKDCGPKFRVTYRPINQPARLPRKKVNWASLSETKQSMRNLHRMVVSVKRHEPCIVRCLTVDSKNAMFLVGKGLIPTHNTRAGVEWVREKVKSGCKRIAAVAATNSDIERVMVNGESGFLARCWKGDKDYKGKPMGLPIWSPTKRLLTWENGAYVQFFSAEEPERLRGPQFEAAWCDELAAWNKDRDTWDMLQFTLRLGKHPQVCVTTTPRPTKLVRDILKNPKTVVTMGSTFDNSANLANTFLAAIKDQYEGTRLGRQELYAEIMDEASGALWNRELLSKCEMDIEDTVEFSKTLQRVVVSVDPAVTSNAESDMTGIIVAGIDLNGCSYVLEDHTDRYTPEGWATRAIELYNKFSADRIVAEKNQGGDMVRHTIHTVDEAAPVRLVHASRGKFARAEPVSALYERGKVKHNRGLDALEDQMVQFEPLGSIGSPDRLDALVWAITDLALKGVAKPTLQLVYSDSKGLLQK